MLFDKYRRPIGFQTICALRFARPQAPRRAGGQAWGPSYGRDIGVAEVPADCKSGPQGPLRAASRPLQAGDPGRPARQVQKLVHRPGSCSEPEQDRRKKRTWLYQ